MSEDDEPSPLNKRISEDEGLKQTSSMGKGVALLDLQLLCGRWGPPPRPYVIPSSNHTVLFKVNFIFSNLLLFYF